MSMEEDAFKLRQKALKKEELTIRLMTEEFNHLHVTYEDREDYKARLSKIEDKYIKYREAATDLVMELDDDIEDSEDEGHAAVAARPAPSVLCLVALGCSC